MTAYLLNRHRLPTARLKAGAVLARERLAKAMIDISDGLLQDLGHICEAGRVGAVIWQETLPLSRAYRLSAGTKGTRPALTGGEDYELLFCLRRRDRSRLDKAKKKLGVPVSRIGKCVSYREGIKVVDGKGKPLPISVKGHDHFKNSG
jgi:thiamine-monophosphate kinase